MPNVFDQFDINPFDEALVAEGVTGPKAAFARSLYQQESGSGTNTKTSNAGAVGGMQIIPTTFASVADPGWDINDPVANSRAGIRYANQMYDRANGDIKLAAAGYYGGPGGLDKAARGVAVSDPRNPDAPTTLQYGAQVADRIAQAILPSAQADELPNVFDQFDAAPSTGGNVFDQFSATKPTNGGFTRGVQPPTSGALGQPTQKADDWMPYLGNQFRQGASSLLGLPALAYDIVNWPLLQAEKALGLPTGPGEFAATKAYEQNIGRPLFQYHQMDVPKTAFGRPDLRAEALGNMASMLGSSIIPSAGMAGTAAKNAIEAGRSVERAVANVAARETGAAVLSGEGMTMGKQYGEPLGLGAAGEMIGGMTGPGIYYGLLHAADKGSGVGIPFLRKFASEDSRKKMATEATAKEFSGELLHPTISKNIAETEAIGAKIPDFRDNITLGKASDSPLIKSYEERFGADAATARRALDMNERATTAIDKFKGDIFPPSGDAVPGAGLLAQHAKTSEQLANNVKQSEDAIRQYTTLAMSRNERDAVSAGEKIIAARQGIAQATKDRAAQLYNDAYETADKAGIRVKTSPFVDTARAIQSTAGDAFQQIPSVTGDIIRKFGDLPQGASISVRDLHDLSKRLNVELADLRFAASNGNLAAPMRQRALAPLQDQIKGTLAHLEDPVYGTAGKQLAEANDFYRTEYAQRFKEGLGAQMMATNRFGARTPPDKIIDGLIMKPNDASGMRDYVNVMGDDPVGLQALQEGVMSKFNREVVTDGVVNPAKVAAFQAKYKDALDVVPWLRDKIDTQANGIRSLVDYHQAQIKNAQDYAKTTIAQLGKTDNPDTLVTQALASRQKMEALVNSATSPEERTAISRAIMDKVVGSNNPDKFIADNAQTLLKGMTPAQLDDIKTVLNARAIVNRVPPPTTVIGQTDSDALRKLTGTSTRSATADIRAWIMGYGSGTSLGAMRLTNAWNHMSNNMKDQVRRDVIFDPVQSKALAEFIRSPNQKNANKVQGYMMPYLARSAALVQRIEDQEHPDQPASPPPPALGTQSGPPMSVSIGGVLPQNNRPPE